MEQNKPVFATNPEVYFLKISITTVSHLLSQANHLIFTVIGQDASLSPVIFFYSDDCGQK